jgi:plastocyanin
MKKIIFSKSRWMVVTILLFSLFSLTNSCKKATDVPVPNEVFIQGMVFSPGTITVAANTTVKWTNKDGVAHTITSNTGLFDSGSISNNGTYSHMFTTASKPLNWLAPYTTQKVFTELP